MKNLTNLNLISTIMDVLDKHDILYQVPNKIIQTDLYKDISVVIQKTTDIKLLSMLVDNIKNDFNLGYYKQEIKDNSIFYSFNDLILIFRLCDRYTLTYSYLYFSYDIIHNLIQLFLKNTPLSYDMDGLFYQLGNRKTLISNDIFSILQFFGIDYNIIFSKVLNYDKLYDVLLNSDIYNTEHLTIDNVKNFDNYITNKSHYDKFINLSQYNKKKYSVFFNNNEKLLTDLIMFFPDCDILNNITEIQLKNMNGDINTDFLYENDDKEEENVPKIIEKPKRKKIKLKSFFK